MEQSLIFLAKSHSFPLLSIIVPQEFKIVKTIENLFSTNIDKLPLSYSLYAILRILSDRFTIANSNLKCYNIYDKSSVFD